jgi:hypothetical protein
VVLLYTVSVENGLGVLVTNRDFTKDPCFSFFGKNGCSFKNDILKRRPSENIDFTGGEK